MRPDEEMEIQRGADRVVGVEALRSLWPGGSKTYTYDAAGRTTQVVAPNGTTNIVYDFESRITSLTGPGITQTSVYNGLDTRVSTTVNNSTRAFGRDGVYVTDPVLTHGTDTSFTPGISERRSGTTTFLHSGLKNADAQSSTAQAITATRTYDAFGMIRSSTGTWRGPFGYAGGFGYQEDASGLRLLGHRYYDASTGRFLTRDPIKVGRNWYVYGAGEANPLTGADPTGLSSIKTPHGARTAAEALRIIAGECLPPVFPDYPGDDGGSSRGRPGGSKHRWMVKALAEAATELGWEVVSEGGKPERRFYRDRDGGWRYADVEIVKNGRRIIIQVGQADSNGNAVKRERPAIDDLLEHGESIFVRYN